MKRGHTCNKAKSLVTGDRAKAYGDAIEDFMRIQHLFNAATGQQIQARHVPIFMICVKLSREFNKHQDDNMIDICGYADLLNSIYHQDDLEPTSAKE